jgi:hypothetical protein
VCAEVIVCLVAIPPLTSHKVEGSVVSGHHPMG